MKKLVTRAQIVTVVKVLMTICAADVAVNPVTVIETTSAPTATIPTTTNAGTLAVTEIITTMKIRTKMPITPMNKKITDTFIPLNCMF